MLNQLSENGNLHVILNYRPLGLVRATANAIDSDGMAVDTGCILLPGRADVEVTLAFHQSGGNRVYRIPARVIRSGPGETRLTFDSEARPAIQSLIDGCAPAAPACPRRPTAWNEPLPATV